MVISESIKYVGVDDREIDLFESQYKVPNGVSYNSYLIMDEKVALIDTVDKRACKEWSEKVDKILAGRKIDYIIIQHMEPDHAGSLSYAIQKNPDSIIVGNEKTFLFLKQFFDVDIDNRKLEVKEGDTLCLGSHTLTFIMAPMVHWPEVMVSYESTEKVLFSADGFGKFGALDVKEEWVDEARRYYINIVGKYGAPVQSLLKKIATLEIEKILPLHGPVLDKDLDHYFDLYDKWSNYKPEQSGVLIAHASIHGNTKNVALKIAEKIKDIGEKNIQIVDLCRDNISKCVSEAFKYDKMILCSSTYDGGAFAPMEDFLHHLKIKTFQNRTVGIVENGTWAPMAGKVIKEYLDIMKDITILEEKVTIKSSYKPENEESIDKFIKNLYS